MTLETDSAGFSPLLDARYFKGEKFLLKFFLELDSRKTTREKSRTSG